MKREQKPFGIFLKTLANGKRVYYYSTYDSDGRRRQFSTGRQNSREAHREVLNRFQKGQLVRSDRLVFRTWTSNWFKYEVCPYIQGRLERGFSYSPVHAANQRSHLIRFLWPALGEKSLVTIRPLEIEDLLSGLFKDRYSRDLVNRCLKVLSLILGEAVRLGLMDRNPAHQVQPRKNLPKEKGILTEEESRRLFDSTTWPLIWRGKREAHLASLLGYQGGLRQGEQIALHFEDIQSAGLIVRRGWDRLGGLKGTKNGDARFVPLPEKTLEALRSLVTDEYVFRLQGRTKPVSPTYLRKSFIEALENIGVSRDDQVRRNIGCHSLRHGLVSNLLALGAPAAVVAAVVGHKALAVTTGTYHHTTSRHLEVVVEAQSKLFTRTDETNMH